MKVLRIGPSDTIHLRQLILRPGGTREECVFEGDSDEQTFHLGSFEEHQLVSVASFYFRKHALVPGENQYQLRGMATLPEHRKKGLSKALLRTAFPIILQNFCDTVWCHARESALGFYTSIGFQIIGEKFEIPNIGPHYLVYKKLENSSDFGF